MSPANTRLDWYGLGYDYRFAYKYNNEGSVVSFYPAIGFALLNFNYNLNGTPGLSASRGFAKAAPQLGLKSEWIPGGPFSVSAGVLSSLPFSTLPLLLSVDLTVGYQLWGRHDHGGMAYLGIGYDRINERRQSKRPQSHQSQHRSRGGRRVKGKLLTTCTSTRHQLCALADPCMQP